MIQPVIKWSGSKRSQSEQIVSLFPSVIKTYYEPFCGGCSVLAALLKSDIKCNNYVCSDANKELIDLWNMIKENPKEVWNHYNILWNELNKDNDLQRKKEFFKKVRNRLNKEHNPLDFMFIMRTTTNGMPRYNASGEFNNSFHVTRNGIEPHRLCGIINEWSDLLNRNNVQFFAIDYREVKPEKEDFVYLDPPYANLKGMYYGGINLNELWNYLRSLQCQYALSFDGISGKNDNTYNVPKDIYTSHIYLRSGNSSFKRIIGKDRNAIVFESLYLNKKTEETRQLNMF